jgi:hypothetical protein
MNSLQKRNNGKFGESIVGILCGFTLILFAFIFESHSCIPAFYLVLCIALGVIVGSLGTTSASVKTKAMAISGSGAIGAIFFYLIQSYINVDRYTEGTISGPFTSESQIILKDGPIEVLGALRGDGKKDYHFLIKGEKLKTNNLKVEISTGDMEINDSTVNKYLARNKIIQWRFDTLNNCMIDLASKAKDTIGKIGNLSIPTLSTNNQFKIANAILNLFIPNCYAQGYNDTISPLINKLSTSNPRVYGESIQKLSKIGTSVTPLVMNAYNESSPDMIFYRTNAAKVMSLLYQQNHKEFISKLDNKSIASLARVSLVGNKYEALYARMLLDSLVHSKATDIVNRVSSIRDSVRRAEYKIWFFAYQVKWEQYHNVTRLLSNQKYKSIDSTMCMNHEAFLAESSCVLYHITSARPVALELAQKLDSITGKSFTCRIKENNELQWKIYVHFIGN